MFLTELDNLHGRSNYGSPRGDDNGRKKSLQTLFPKKNEKKTNIATWLNDAIQLQLVRQFSVLQQLELLATSEHDWHPQLNPWSFV